MGLPPGVSRGLIESAERSCEMTCVWLRSVVPVKNCGGPVRMVTEVENMTALNNPCKTQVRIAVQVMLQFNLCDHDVHPYSAFLAFLWGAVLYCLHSSSFLALFSNTSAPLILLHRPKTSHWLVFPTHPKTSHWLVINPILASDSPGTPQNCPEQRSIPTTEHTRVRKHAPDIPAII
jgi:hypothetical protein